MIIKRFVAVVWRSRVPATLPPSNPFEKPSCARIDAEHCALGAKRHQILDETSSESETQPGSPQCFYRVARTGLHYATVYDTVFV
jgi:hypothetical protein